MLRETEIAAETARALRPQRCPGSHTPMPAASPGALCLCGETFGQQPPVRVDGAVVWLVPEHEGRRF